MEDSLFVWSTNKCNISLKSAIQKKNHPDMLSKRHHSVGCGRITRRRR